MTWSSRSAGVRSVTESRSGEEFQCLMSCCLGIELYYMSEQGEVPLISWILGRPVVSVDAEMPLDA